MLNYAYLGNSRALMKIDNFNVVFDTRDTGMLYTLLQKEYEPDVYSALSAHVLPGDCFIDVGANVGMHSLRLNTRLRPNGLMYCFEPNPNLFAILQQNMHLNGGMANVILRRQAVFSSEGTVMFSHNEQEHRVGAIVLENAENYGSTLYEVETIRLDSLDVGSRDVVIKIDVEGREGGVIEGGQQLIASRAKMVVMEFHRHIIASTGTNVDQLLGRFKAWNFTPFICQRNGPEKTTFDALAAIDRHINIAFIRTQP